MKARKVRKKTGGIRAEFAEQNAILRQMLEKMPGPAGKFRNMMEIIVTIVGVLAIADTVDVILRWFIGG